MIWNYQTRSDVYSSTVSATWVLGVVARRLKAENCGANHECHSKWRKQKVLKFLRATQVTPWSWVIVEKPTSNFVTWTKQMVLKFLRATSTNSMELSQSWEATRGSKRRNFSAIYGTPKVHSRDPLWQAIRIVKLEVENNGVLCFSFMMRNVPVSFITIFKPSDTTAIPPGPLKAWLGYKKNYNLGQRQDPNENICVQWRKSSKWVCQVVR